MISQFLAVLFIVAVFLESTSGFEKDVRPIIEHACLKCHGGEKVKGQVDFSKILTEEDADAQFELWETVVAVIAEGEMPPEDEKRLTTQEQHTISNWYERRLEAPIVAHPGIFRPRRLSGPEYRNTLRSLFGFDLNVSIAKAEQTKTGEESLVLKLLPEDPPGASGFVNDTHGAQLSTTIWSQYLQITDAALEKLFSVDGRAQLVDYTGTDADFTTPQAESLIRTFVPRAYRRPVPEDQIDKHLEAIAGKAGDELIKATKSELRAVLMSPAFLYRGILMDGTPGKQQAVDNFELAERLSYFLWEDMPDDELLTLAASGSLSDSKVITQQVDRMLSSPKARSLAESFGVQWLLLNSMDEVLGNDQIGLHAFKTQPVEFLNYLFTGECPVMEIIDSKTTFINMGISGFYGKDREKLTKVSTPRGIERSTTPHEKITMEHAEGRGGILTMPGILRMNADPIQRGTWILRQILGVQLGEPPADVPPIQPSPRGKNLSFRQRFEIHRSDPTCARCHDKIDPIGFALEAYDNKGQFLLASDRKKSAKANKVPDTSGKLPSGETFQDFAGLKSILMTSQKESVVRNIVSRTLAYALARKLQRSDQLTVDEITKNICENKGTWKSLFCQIATSLPFKETIIEEK